MAKVSELQKGNDSCNHKFVKRDKKTIQILHRVCTECGKEELHSEQELTESEAKKIMKVN